MGLTVQLGRHLLNRQHRQHRQVQRLPLVCVNKEMDRSQVQRVGTSAMTTAIAAVATRSLVACLSPSVWDHVMQERMPSGAVVAHHLLQHQHRLLLRLRHRHPQVCASRGTDHSLVLRVDMRATKTAIADTATRSQAACRRASVWEHVIQAKTRSGVEGAQRNFQFSFYHPRVSESHVKS